MEHLDEEVLIAHTVGALPAGDAPAVEAHLRDCEACRRRQHNLSSIVFSRTVPATPSSDRAPGPARGPATRPDAPAARAAVLDKGTELGRYLLLDRLGAGGMGEVFAAYDPQLDRKVALKLLRSGSLSAEEGKARLLREAQAMARLQHPNVIAVHDVGMLADRVFIAMEFVEGQTLGDWLHQDHRWKDVLRVFLEAGAGLAAAHTAGLVHRDFKPDNVLLGKDGRPRVVDFGLARQSTATPPIRTTSQELPLALADTSLAQPLTRDGAVMGTPGYMAPEQIAGLPTDARSDQFSFCVALYEALYGRRPFGGSTLRQHAQEIAAGVLPAPPHGTPVPSWVLEVLKKGLSANPSERYPDMQALLRALAPRQSRAGRTVAAAAGLALVAASAIGVGLWQNQRLRVCGGAETRLAGVWDRETRGHLKEAFLATRLSFAPDVWAGVERALDAYALEWVNGMREACEAARIRQVDSPQLYEMKTACLEGRLQRLRALTRLFETADRDVVANASAAARSLESPAACLDANAALSQRRSTDERERKAEEELRLAVVDARALFDAGKYAQARDVLRKAVRADSPPRAMAEALLWLGRIETRNGDPKASHAANLLAAEQALKAGDAPLQARAFSRLYANEGYDDPRDDAESWGRLAHAAAARVTDDWELDAELAGNDALVNLKRNAFKAALADLERVLALQEEHQGPEHPDVAMTLNNLGVTLTNLGRYDEAIEKYQRSLELHERLEGKDHPETGHAEHNLGYVLRRQGRYAEARAHYERALEVRRAALGPEHKETIDTAQALAKVYIVTGQRELALPLLEQALAVRQQVYGAQSKEVAQIYDLFAELYQAGSDWKEAQKYAELELAVVKKTSGEGSLPAARAAYTLGVILTRQGAWVDAKKQLDEALAIRTAKLGDDNNEVASVLNATADWMLAQKRAAEALPLYEKALGIRERSGASTGESMADDLLGQGESLMALDRATEAVAPFERALALREKVEDQAELGEARYALGKALWVSKSAERERAAQLLREGVPALPAEARREAEAWLARNGLHVLDGGAGPPDGGT